MADDLGLWVHQFHGAFGSQQHKKDPKKIQEGVVLVRGNPSYFKGITVGEISYP